MRLNSRAEALLEPAQVGFDLGNRIGIVFLDRKAEELVSVAEPRLQFVEYDNDLFELCTLLPQRLGPLWFVPHIGLLQLALDFGQSFRLAVVVKDTSSTQRCVQQDPRSTV